MDWFKLWMGITIMLSCLVGYPALMAWLVITYGVIYLPIVIIVTIPISVVGAIYACYKYDL